MYLVAALALVGGCASTDVSTTVPVQAEVESRQQTYDWTQTPDFDALRQQAGTWEDFMSRCEMNRPLDEMTNALEQKDWTRVTEIGERYLQQCPVDIRTHYYTAIAYSEMDREDVALHHFAWTEGMMDSIVRSGDGKDCDSAYVTISVSEEYDALYFFGLRHTSQGLTPDGCDVFSTENKDGKEFTLYFNPAAHFLRLNKMLDGIDD